jgi:hypothetical protein
MEANLHDFDVVDVRRIVIRRPNGERYYITIGDCSMMAHRPNESAYSNAVEYHGMNAVCRLASKLRSKGVTWGQIALQIRDAGIGHHTVFNDMARIIREYVQSEDYLNEQTER